MQKILVDSNVILDIFTQDPQWFEWSDEQLTRLADMQTLCINPIIYTEVSIGFTEIESLEDALPAFSITLGSRVFSRKSVFTL